MYRLALSFFAAFVLVLVSGCNEQTPTANSIQSEQSLLKPPASSGVVVRVEGFGDYLVWRDGDLVIVIGENPNWSCDNVVQEFDLQYITSPSNEDGARIIAKLVAKDAFVQVFESLVPSPICDILSSPVVASGNVKVQYNDNDVYGSVVHNANSYKFSANGKVTGSDGKAYNLNAFLNGSYNAKNDQEKRKIQLTPTGKK